MIQRQGPTWVARPTGVLQRVSAPFRLAAKTGAFVFGGLNSFLSQWGNWGQGSWYQTDPRLGGTDYNYREAVGDGRGSAIIMGVVAWLCRTFPEAELTVGAPDEGGDRKIVQRHPMVRLIATPNPYYSGILLWMATLADWVLTGNAYWIKVRNGVGAPVQLYWAPARLIEPRWPSDGTVYVSHYEYRPFGQPIALRPEDVVHFRYGIDPMNVRKGVSLVATLLREIFTDDEAANYTAAILKNLGVVGAIVSPEGTDTEVSKDTAERIKAEFRQKFGGDNRGDVMVAAQAIKVATVAFNPRDMSLKDIRRIPEERVTAIFGIPAVVVGLGAGLDRSTFSNFAEARIAAYESNVFPTQRLFAAELQTQLLPDFSDVETYTVAWDYSEVRALQDDKNGLYTRLSSGVLAGWVMPNEARMQAGMDAQPAGDVFYVPVSVTAVPADQPQGLELPVPLGIVPNEPPAPADQSAA